MATTGNSRSLGLALLLAALLAGPQAGPAAAAPADDDPPREELEDWLKYYLRGKTPLDTEQVELVRGLAEGAVDARLAGEDPAVPEDEDEDARALEHVLLQIAGLDLVPSRRRREEAKEPLLPALRGVGRESLGVLAQAEGPPLLRWLADGVVGDEDAEVESRIAAAQALAGRHAEPTRAALLEATEVDDEPLLVFHAYQALAGWNDPVVTDFLLSGFDIGAVEESRTPMQTLRDHFALLTEREAMGPETERQLLEFAKPHLVSDDWRSTARALELLEPVNLNEVYGVLVDALEAWAARRGEELASRRIENDIAEDLRRRSGRSIGNHPERWRHWWTMVQEGKIPPPEDPDEREATSEASFFSLRPATNRVTFVIDRSGSMSARFGKEQRVTRYEMAMRQTLDYLLVSGEETEFNVFLFSSGHLRYKRSLQKATERNRRALEKWLAENGPSGGTELEPAIVAALELDRDGDVDLQSLESDTIIVLCDGATNEGSGWVEPTLSRIHDEARVTFHCVQIGDDGDGTLEALARLTGGDFIHVD